MPWPIVPAPITATRGALMRRTDPPRAGRRRENSCRARPRRATAAAPFPPAGPRSRPAAGTPPRASDRRGRGPRATAPATGWSLRRRAAAPAGARGSSQRARRGAGRGACYRAAEPRGDRRSGLRSPKGWGPARARRAADRRSAGRGSSPRRTRGACRPPGAPRPAAAAALRSPGGTRGPARASAAECGAIRRGRRRGARTGRRPWWSARPAQRHRRPSARRRGDLELPLALGDKHVEPLDELRDLLTVQLAAVFVELCLVGLHLIVPLVVAPLEPPHVRPVGGRRVVGAEQVERRRDPLVEELLD